jgi:hypothetical protein
MRQLSIAFQTDKSASDYIALAWLGAAAIPPARMHPMDIAAQTALLVSYSNELTC